MENIEDYRIRIVTGQYQKAPLKQKKMIQKLFGEDAEYRYEIYFHWYNVLHELGHAIMMFNASARPHSAEEEQLVNNFAYAYWQHYGEQKKIKTLSFFVDETIRKFTIPSSGNEDYMDYAKSVRRLPCCLFSSHALPRIWFMNIVHLKFLSSKCTL